MVDAYGFVFPAIRGVQAHREYYVAMCPLKQVFRIFQFDGEDVPPQLRSQRVLNKARIPEITNYIVAQPKEYVFSSITASIDGQVEFRPVADKGPGRDLGSLHVPMDARIIINDGQHRRAAIEEAVKVRPELSDEHISVVFFVDRGLKKSQQMFADLNKHAIRPTKSIGILFDHRDATSRLACNVIEQVPIFRELIEMEKTTISNRSIKLFTLSSVYQATASLLKTGKKDVVGPKEEAIAVEFWNELSTYMKDWQLAAQRKVASAELRRDYIHAHGVILHAMGIAGGDLIAEEPKRWKTRLKKFETVDWRRSSKTWEGKALVNGKVSKAHHNLMATAGYLKEILGVASNRFQSNKSKTVAKVSA